MFNRTVIIGLGLAFLIGSCSGQRPSIETAEDETAEEERLTRETLSVPTVVEGASATITDVEASELSPSQHNFSVTVQSPDTGCDAYANWWEVITPEGELLYRRILAHSHVDEQPFTRSGGPVAVGAADEVIVRSHMHPTGYSTQAMQGTPTEGFIETVLPEDFAAGLAAAEPQPSGCAF